MVEQELDKRLDAFLDRWVKYPSDSEQQEGEVPQAHFDNRGTWDNLGPGWDNQPTWDNWDNRR